VKGFLQRTFFHVIIGIHKSDMIAMCRIEAVTTCRSGAPILAPRNHGYISVGFSQAFRHQH